MKKRYFIFLLAFILIIILIQVLHRYFSSDEKTSSYDYSDTKKKMLNGVIQRVIISRYTRIEIDNEKEVYMIAADFPFPLNNPKTDTLFSVGDSIIKKANNDTFSIIRRGNFFYYILPK